MSDLPAPPILIVAADDLVAADLRTTLARTGFTNLEEARDGSSAIEHAATKEPSLAIVDLRLMDGLDGAETAAELSDDFGIKVLFLTSQSPSAMEMDRARAANPVGYIRRPYSDDELAAAIEAAISGVLSVPDENETTQVELAKVFETLSDSVFVTNEKGEVRFANLAAKKLISIHDEDKLYGLPLDEIAPLSVASSSPFATLVTHQGDRRPVLREVSRMTDVDGETVGEVIVLRDVRTSISGPNEEPPAALRQAIEMSKRESFRELIGMRKEPTSSEQLLPSEIAIAMEKIADPFIMMTSEWRVTYANAAALGAFGAEEPLLGRPFWDNFPGKTRERFAASFAGAQREERVIFDFEDPQTNSWYETGLYPAGEGGIIAIFRDITEQKRAEVDRIRMQRLEGLGLLARGFAHDFNNLLTVLVGNLSLAKERYPDDPDFQDEMKAVEGATDDARGLVQQLLTFARGGQPVREQIRVPSLLRRILDGHRKSNPKIRYQFQCGNRDLLAAIDAEQITRLLENLIENAEQAMPGGGTLIARCGTTGAEEAALMKGAAVQADQPHLVLEIIDTGDGMTSEVVDHAFDPYFTTRRDANATGIGLTVCESIAKAHGGFILLQSKPERGTIATFCMPMQSEEPLYSPSEAAAAEARHSFGDRSSEIGSVISSPGSRILVLEDDPMIRRLISFTLQRDGHEVVETADGTDTIRMFHEARDCGLPFDLVISDLTIEDGLGGVDTIRELRSIDPDLVAIASSGYSDAPAMARPAEYGFVAALPKPYPPRDLRKLVSRVLGARPIIG